MITISTVVDQDSTVISVNDTDIGIAADQQARVWECFFRIDKARSRDGRTGLGLAIVKHLAQAFGGSVQLESPIGKGSTFRVRLPRMLDSD